MLRVFPLSTARDRRWWSHCRSLGRPKCQRVSFQDSSRWGSGFAMHTSGFDCHWLKVINVKKVIVFPAFVGLSISCYTAWYSGTDYVVTFCKGVHNCCVPQGSCLYTRVKPSGLLLSLVRPKGLKAEGKPIRVNDRMRMEFMTECLGMRPAFLMQERP